jgi:hypothetical protein
MKDRTTSICEQKRAWQVGRAMMFGPQRFSELLRFISHHDALCRCMRKMVNDGLAKQLNDQRYEHGRGWIECALPILVWTERHPRNPKPAPQPRGNDPVLGLRSDINLEI